jgi:serine/threonine protein phosphatase PrpC
MICAGNTDIGMRRSSNQDTFILKTYSEKTCLCVVCDGMGGAKGGNEASRIASEKFASVIDDFITPYIGRKDRTLHSNDVRDALLDAVEQYKIEQNLDDVTRGHFVPCTKYLNAIGGVRMVDTLSRNEIKKICLNVLEKQDSNDNRKFEEKE